VIFCDAVLLCFQVIQQLEVKGGKLVFFDLETTGLGRAHFSLDLAVNRQT
jgi:uncharacterized protein YprB with RNaseH-like and TPR domain